MRLDDYDRTIEEAFSFLVSEFGYESQPARSGGGRFGSGLTKTFRRGRQTITLLVGDADSSVFYDVWFSDGDDAEVEPSRHHFRHRTLYFLLKRKGIDFEIPGSWSLESDALKRDALIECGKVVKEHALDVVKGDFSAFPQLVYVVHHVDRHYPMGDVRRLIGVFSSFAEAEKAIAERRTKPGYVVRQDGFEVDCFELDFGTWFAGIPVDPPKQASEFFNRVLKSTSLAEFNEEERRQIEAQWLSKFSTFQLQFEVSRAKANPQDSLSAALIATYPPDHYAWSLVVDEAGLRLCRASFIDEIKSRPLAIECWRKAKQHGLVHSRFVAFVEEEHPFD